MAFEQKPNSGVLFKNLDKVGDDKRPHAKGRAKIGDTEYWVAAWTRTDKNGEKYQTLVFEQMEAQRHPRESGDQRRQAPPPRQAQEQPKADDCPF